MGYLVVIGFAALVIPLVYFLISRRGESSTQGEVPLGKPVMVTEPSADEATPAASSIQKDTTAAQRRTPPA